jgi:hypothetical protein
MASSMEVVNSVLSFYAYAAYVIHYCIEFTKARLLLVILQQTTKCASRLTVFKGLVIRGKLTILRSLENLYCHTFFARMVDNRILRRRILLRDIIFLGQIVTKYCPQSYFASR